MKNLILLTCFISLLIPNFILAQTWQRISPTTEETYNDISFADSLNIWVVGTNGTIVHSSDRGTSWNEQESQTTLTLNSVQFINENEGWIVGGKSEYQSESKGIILHTIDAGNTWSIDSVSTHLFDVCFVNSQKGWILGEDGKYFFTENGGIDWLPDDFLSLIFPTVPYSSLEDLVSIHFIDESNGWVIGSGGGVVKTIDGGDTWETNMISDVLENREVFFLDSLKGWITGHTDTGVSGAPINPSDLWLTSDGGQTWEPNSNSSFTRIRDVNSIVFANDDLGWCVGKFKPSNSLGWLNLLFPPTLRNNYISQTNNGGEDWEIDEFFQSNIGTYQKVVVDRGEVWVVGGLGLIINKNFTDEDWTLKRDVYQNLNDVEFVTSEKLIAIGDDGRMIYSFDSGSSWQNATRFSNSKLLDIHFIDENNGYVVGELGEIWYTQNGGDTWESQSSNVNVLLNGVDFVSLNLGWAVGDSSTILHTIDGGDTWTQQFTDSIRLLRSVDFIDENFGWAVGDYGYYLTEDGGNEWQFFDFEKYSLGDVQFLNSQDGYMAVRSIVREMNPLDPFPAFVIDSMGNIIIPDANFSAGRYLLQTNDGGLTWESSTDSTKSELRSLLEFGGLNTIQIFDNNNRILAGLSGIYVKDEDNLELMKMENGGELYNSNWWKGIDCYDINNCVVVGSNGSIGKLGNDNIILSSNALTTDISNILIFPNPNQDGFVSCKNVIDFYQMKLYDFQGRLVEQFSLDENSNLFEFNLATFSNGIYWMHFIGENKFATTKIIFQN